MATEKYKKGILTAKSGTQVLPETAKTGVQQLNPANERDGYLYVPPLYDKSRPAALAVMLHGAGAVAAQGLHLLQRYADASNMILVAPASRKYTWDIIADRVFGPDVFFIDQVLTTVFEQYAIDTGHLAIGGFSDGASYAFSLGLSNGDLFSHIIAFSPGFAYALQRRGKPSVFISHGVNDTVLPIGPCSRRIVPQLKQQGLEVKYTEFKGGHEVPDAIVASAVQWFTGQPAVDKL